MKLFVDQPAAAARDGSPGAVDQPRGPSSTGRRPASVAAAAASSATASGRRAGSARRGGPPPPASPAAARPARPACAWPAAGPRGRAPGRGPAPAAASIASSETAAMSASGAGVRRTRHLGDLAPQRRRRTARWRPPPSGADGRRGAGGTIDRSSTRLLRPCAPCRPADPAGVVRGTPWPGIRPFRAGTALAASWQTCAPIG